MARRAFGSSTFSKTPSAPKVGGHGRYNKPSVLSPRQFHNSNTQVRERVTIGNTHISVSAHGARFSVGGAGYRFSSGGRIMKRTTIKNG